MENEWTDLKIDNLPSDILTGDYEFEGDFNGPWEYRNNDIEVRMRCLDNIRCLNKGNYRYRKTQPKAPTHEEIMTKWWKVDNKQWSKVIAFDKTLFPYMFLSNDVDIESVKASFFIDKESSDIPPE